MFIPVMPGQSGAEASGDGRGGEFHLKKTAPGKLWGTTTTSTVPYTLLTVDKPLTGHCRKQMAAGFIAGYSALNHACVFLFCRKQGTLAFCFASSMSFLIPMFCENRMNQTLPVTWIFVNDFMAYRLVQRTS